MLDWLRLHSDLILSGCLGMVIWGIVATVVEGYRKRRSECTTYILWGNGDYVDFGEDVSLQEVIAYVHNRASIRNGKEVYSIHLEWKRGENERTAGETGEKRSLR